MALLDSLKKNLSVTRKVATEKAKLAKDIFTTREAIRSSKKEIRTLTFKIGQTYMELHPDDFDPAFADYFRGIAEAKDAISANQQKLDELKAQIKPEEAAEIDILDETDEFFDDIEEKAVEAEVEEAEATEAVEEIAEEAEATEAVEEVAEEVVEAVEEITEEVAEPVEEIIEEVAEAVEE